ncbi:helicase, partial [Synechococcus sp. R6-7]
VALAQFLLEEALDNPEKGDAVVSRCGALRTRAVVDLTTLLLLRVRYLVEQPQGQPLLAEEVLVLGGVGLESGEARWLETGAALQLLATAKPDENLPLAEKRELVQHLLTCLDPWQETEENWGRDHRLQQAARERILQRAAELEAAHRRIRQAVSLQGRGLKVKPQLPPDLLGLLVLQPVVCR